MIAPERPRVIHKLARFSLETIIIPMGIGQSIYSTSTLVIALFCVHAPRGRYRAPFFVQPTSPHRRKHPSCCTSSHARKLFSPCPYLSTFACAIEVQHNNENSTTVHYPQKVNKFLHISIFWSKFRLIRSIFINAAEFINEVSISTHKTNIAATFYQLCFDRTRCQTSDSAEK